MKPAKVYFADARAKEFRYSHSLPAKLKQLLKAHNIETHIKKKDKVAIKTHFGTRGCFRTVRPIFLRIIVDAIKELGAHPFVTDTGALSKLEDATINGINPLSCNAPVLLADGIDASDCIMLKTGGKCIDEIGVAGAIYDADAMVVVSHCKGHIQSAYGGAIKNVAMGCVSSRDRNGNVQRAKMHVRSKTPFEWNSELCTLCEQCIEVCGVDAIHREEDKIVIDRDRCWQCARCVRACPSGALGPDMDQAEFAQGMAEVAKTVLSTFKEKKVFYINFMMEFQPECDCMPECDVPVIQDQGILISEDIVAIDTASLDLVGRAKPLPESQAEERGITEPTPEFLTQLTARTPWFIIDKAQELGLGLKKYNLVHLKPS